MNKSVTQHLPMWPEELAARGWHSLDVLLISGDDYFDSPSHGIALIGRILEDAGYRIAIIARPDWKDPKSLLRFGMPELFVGISAGAVDSTLNNYTADLAPRRDDAYAAKESTPRPNFATAVYCGAAKAVFPNTPIVLGGVEASTRRFAYYDYLKKQIRRSVLVDTRADILVYGSGEKAVLEIAARLKQSRSLDNIAGTAQLVPNANAPHGVALPDYNNLVQDASLLIDQTATLENQLGPYKSVTTTQRYTEGTVVVHPPAILTTKALDRYHALPFLRTAHPSYKSEIPAAIPVRWSVIAQRGCPGGCSFCALAYHQGRMVVSRSEESILNEVKTLARHPEFTGTITDIGGPTANAFGLSYKVKEQCTKCKRPSCLYPSICGNFVSAQDRFIQLLRAAKKLPGIKHLFVASGIRHDLALRHREIIIALAREFTGGHLKAAPEHTQDTVLKFMRKPPIGVFEQFEQIFLETSKKQSTEQYVVPYFIAGFPGCTPDAANHSGTWLKKRNQRLRQVQNFIPLPGTMAAAMYACALDGNKNSLYIPDAKERRRQKMVFTGERVKTCPNRKKTFRPGQQRKKSVKHGRRSKRYVHEDRTRPR